MPRKQKKDPPSSEDEESNSFTLADMLMTADAIVSQDIPVKGPPITMEVVDCFTKYLAKNTYIKKILLFGLNAGRVERVIEKLSYSRTNG